MSKKNKKKDNDSLSKTPDGSTTITVEKIVSDYLSSIGFKVWHPHDNFWGYLNKTYGNTAAKIEKLTDKREAGYETSEFYLAKNTNLKLSIDIASGYYHDLYQKYLEWFIKEQFDQPNRLLDIGCENGILTCFYSQIYPDAEVIGIDNCSQAIQCAQELSKKLNLSNVKFITADVNGLPSNISDLKFDCITAVAVFHEIFPFLLEKERYWSIDDLNFSNKYPVANKLASNLRSLLATPSSNLISLNRASSDSALTKLCNIFNGAGLSSNWERSYALRFRDDLNEDESLAVLAFCPALNPKPTNNDDLLAFCAYLEGNKDQMHIKLEGSMAEAVFRSLAATEKVWGRQITYNDGSGVMRVEIGRTGALALRYTYTNIGYRELILVPKITVKELINQAEIYTKNMAQHATIDKY